MGDMNQSLVRGLVDLRDRTLQKSRIAFGLRMDAVERGVDTMTPEQLAIVEKWEERFKALEDEATDEIRKMVTGDKVIEAAASVKGIGLMLAAKIISMIDIEKADTVSALWRYAGYAVFDGEREKPVHGEKLHYNNRLKSSCYVMAGSLLRSGSPYRKVYDSAREYYDANRPDWTKLHKHNAALRKMIKIWLSHLWEVWRKIEGLPTRDLYVQEKLGHEHYYTPEEFGWKY